MTGLPRLAIATCEQVHDKMHLTSIIKVEVVLETDYYLVRSCYTLTLPSAESGVIDP